MSFPTRPLLPLLSLLLSPLLACADRTPYAGSGDAKTPPTGSPDAGSPDAAAGPVDGNETLPAFPGAVGWAAGTPGGRGGQIIRVTTLALSGPGSLVAALTTPGPRIVVFEVGGVIDMRGGKLSITSPYLTVAGQTAPSPGITLNKGGLTIRTHDVVLQHIRIRPGEAGHAKTSGWEVDSLSTADGAYNVIVDHCSTSWGTDENLSASGERFFGATPDDWRNGTSHVITFSHNIVAEGLSNSTHSEGEHSKGGLIHDNVTRIALVGNLYFSNMDRHPLFKGGARGIVVNNVVANPGRYAMRYNLSASEWTGHAPETGMMSIVGNVLIPGPSTPANVPLLRIDGVGPLQHYLADNLAKDTSGADAAMIGGATANGIAMDRPPLWPDGLEAAPASATIEAVRLNVGARPWDRDAVDARIVEQALGGRGAIIHSEMDVGGYPAIAEATAAPFVEDEWDLRFMVRKPVP
jgi:hypothetical protein